MGYIQKKRQLPIFFNDFAVFNGSFFNFDL